MALIKCIISEIIIVLDKHVLEKNELEYVVVAFILHARFKYLSFSERFGICGK